MPPRRELARRLLALLAASGAFVLASCGTDDGLGRRFPVSGKVTYNGAPLAKGVISFVPDATGGVGATGPIEEGSYELSTGGDRDGARAGKYKVTVTAKEDFQAKAKADFEKAAGGKSGPAYVPKEFLAKAATAAKDLVPPGYGDVRATTLAAEVKEQSNSINFELSDADAPPAPKASTAGRPR